MRVLGITSSIATVFIVAAIASSAEQPTPYYDSVVDTQEAVTNPLADPQAQGFGLASELGPFGINWVLEKPQAGTAEVIQAGGGVLCLKLKGDINNTFVLRPVKPIPLPERTQRINIYTCLEKVSYLRFQWLIKGADGIERPFQANLGAGVTWRKISSV